MFALSFPCEKFRMEEYSLRNDYVIMNHKREIIRYYYIRSSGLKR